MNKITDKIDAITHIPLAYRNEVLPAPRSVKIELTGRCNFKCTFCARSDRLREQKEMDWGLFTHLLDEMREAGVEELGLFYLGESFMSKRLEEAVDYAKKLGFPYVFLTTNGSLATPDRVESLFRNGLDSLKFSLNYADKDQFEDIARVKGKMFDTMLINMKAAKAVRDAVESDTGHRCGLYASYIEYDGEQGVRMKEMADSMRHYVDELYALPLYSQAGFVTERELDAGMKPQGGNRGRLDNLADGLPCWAMFSEGHISWDGKLTGCCFSHTPAFDFGDLITTPFMDAWNSDIAQGFRHAHLAKDVTGTACEGCFKEAS
jgi:MoaA/NifB/PqqE/SkfB family radical SAM enzyme